jgi:hypothetical protein
LLAILAGAAVVNAGVLGRELAEHAQRWKGRTGVELRMMLSNTSIMPETHPYGPLLPADGLSWLVGDAAVFYVDRPLRYFTVFNRDPWLTMAEAATPEEALEWLRTQGAVRVVFSWTEIERLRSTYGFPPFVTREWVARLEAAGLRHVASPGRAPAEIDVFEVPPR